jgi:hypothetical protein
VPVAVNLYKLRRSEDGSADFLRSLQRQKDQYQGLWLVAPDGRVVAGHHDVKNHANWTQEVLATLDEAQMAFGPRPPRRVTAGNHLPWRGCGMQRDGSVSLALYARNVHRARADGPLVVDSVNLTRDHWAAFTPRKLEPGAEWTLPEPVARQFARALSPVSDQSVMPLPQDAHIAELRARVENVGDDQARLRLTGRWEAAHAAEGDAARIVRATAIADGAAIVDLKQSKLTSLQLVFEGTYRHFAPYDAPRETGAVVEWTWRNDTAKSNQ